MSAAVTCGAGFRYYITKFNYILIVHIPIQSRLKFSAHLGFDHFFLSYVEIFPNNTQTYYCLTEGMFSSFIINN